MDYVRYIMYSANGHGENGLNLHKQHLRKIFTQKKSSYVYAGIGKELKIKNCFTQMKSTISPNTVSN